MAHKWALLTDIDAPNSLAKEAIRALSGVWREHRERLVNRPAYRLFEKKLKREWAIETGLIENIYSLDRGITQLLIERGISAALIPRQTSTNPDKVVAMIRDHEQAVEGLFDFATGTRPVSTSYIKELHALMTRHQDTVEGIDFLGRSVSIPLSHGQFKSRPNNPLRPFSGSIHEYCPPEHVVSEMDRLIELHHEHQESGIAPEVQAAWLHHRFTQIHPFQDGNGRVARALASLIFIKAEWFPLVVQSREKAAYIDVLEAADRGDLAPLVDYFSRLQKRTFVRALSISDEVKKEQQVADRIASIKQDMQRRRDSLVQEWEVARSVAEALREHAISCLNAVAVDLKKEMAEIWQHANFFADCAAQDGGRSHYFRQQIIKTARAMDYYANLQTHKAWARLVLPNANRTEVLFAFRGIGHEFQGVLACSASLFQRVDTDEGEREIGPVIPLMDELFLIHYNESEKAATARFSGWLEEALARSLRLWHESI